jgi:hypothetical protein
LTTHLDIFHQAVQRIRPAESPDELPATAVNLRIVANICGGTIMKLDACKWVLASIAATATVAGAAQPGNQDIYPSNKVIARALAIETGQQKRRTNERGSPRARSMLRSPPAASWPACGENRRQG